MQGRVRLASLLLIIRDKFLGASQTRVLIIRDEFFGVLQKRVLMIRDGFLALYRTGFCGYYGGRHVVGMGMVSNYLTKVDLYDILSSIMGVEKDGAVIGVIVFGG